VRIQFENMHVNRELLVLLTFLMRQSSTDVGLAFRVGGSGNVEAWFLRDRLLG
jgi:hypothetical protein